MPKNYNRETWKKLLKLIFLGEKSAFIRDESRASLSSCELSISVFLFPRVTSCAGSCD